MRRSALIVFGATAMILMAGCLGYRVGTLLPEDIRTIYVPAFGNKTGERNLEVGATNAVINKLNVDGTLKVVSKEEEADSVLKVTIVDYGLLPVRRRDVSNPSEYRVTVIVEATLMNQHTGESLWKNKKKRLGGESEFVIRGGLPSSERAALPAAFDDLAHDIVEAIVEGWD